MRPDRADAALGPASVSAAIVSFHPDERLVTLTQALLEAGIAVSVIDNASAGPGCAGDGTRVLDEVASAGASVTRLATNTGVAGALAVALDACETDWLWTFDQDSGVEPGFVEALLAAVATADNRTAMIGPVVVDEASGHPLQGEVTGGPAYEVPRLLTSGAVCRVEALREVGGFRRDLVIDLVDWDLCLRLRRVGWALLVEPAARLRHAIGHTSTHHVPGLGDVRTTHHAPDRQYYKARNFTLLAREGALADEPRWALRTALGLGIGVAKIALFEDRKTEKIHAVAAGVADGLRGRAGSRTPDTTPVTPRPQVSVCMATFNGSRWIGEQVDSILAQLGPGDELLVTDDVSSDETVALLEAYADPRIVVERATTNVGPIGTFEKVLARASHDIVFLSDQDDVWLPGKIDAMVAEFARPAVQAVVTDAIIVTDGVETGHYFEHAHSGPGVVHNFVKNSYLGCCMAVRRGVLAVALPVPRSVRTHDGWIGICADMLGEVVFLPTPYVLYRRHGDNASGMERFGLADIARRRVALAANLLRITPGVVRRSLA